MESRFTHVSKLQVAFGPLKGRGPLGPADHFRYLNNKTNNGGQGSLNTENM